MSGKGSVRSMGKADAAGIDHHEPGWYEIRLGGHLEHRWAGWFEGMRLTHEANGDTLLTGAVNDQAALHGLLKKARDLGLPLISVMPIDPKQVDGSDAGGESDHNRSEAKPIA